MDPPMEVEPTETDGPIQTSTVQKRKRQDDLEPALKRQKVDPVEGWTVDQVVDWASKIIKPVHAEKLKKEEIDGFSLLEMTYEKLVAKPIKMLSGPATNLMKAIEGLKGPKTQEFKTITIEHLMENPNLIQPTPPTPSAFPFVWQERLGTSTALSEITQSLLNAFKDPSTDRTHHPFPSLLTGSGMGKTRFGQEEAPRVVAKVLETNDLSLDKKIFIDFNGGGDAVTKEDLDAGPEVAMAMRLVARAFFGVSCAEFRLALSEAHLSLEKFSSRKIFKALAKKDATVCVYLHIDEFQLAHEQCLEMKGPQNFVKSMIYEIGMYRVGPARFDRVFVIPFLSATKILPVEPFSVPTALNLLKQECGDSPLLENSEFKFLLQQLGIVPRYLEWLRFIIKNLKNKKNIWQNPGDQDFSIGHLGTLILEKDFQIDYLVSSLGSELPKFLSWCLTRTSVNWETTINNRSLSDLSTKGNIFLAKRDGGFHLWFPEILLSLLVQQSDQTLLQKMITFPPSVGTLWKKFEVLSLGLVVVRNNLSLSQGKQSCLIRDLFPGALGNDELLQLSLRLSSLSLVTETQKWITGTTTVNTSDGMSCLSLQEVPCKVTFSERKSALLCAPGTSFLDGRIQFLDQENKPVLVVLQMKATSSNKYLGLEDLEQIYKVKKLLTTKKRYPGHKIVVGVISNRPVSSDVCEKIIKWESFFLISKNQLASFAPCLEHRFQ